MKENRRLVFAMMGVDEVGGGGCAPQNLGGGEGRASQQIRQAVIGALRIARASLSFPQ